ncbi:hypothetical protein E4656_07095 [Natronospirillum operosum]|uniref:SbsA Ig-like domain-containing protein n=1 Tax=Natronospirillum operosum TaxID=2759953 RepID=A0A4Z0WBM7_9GAMM|nr:Ig-like domain-containing protein [Natronospirillum operosum]TGG93945.1 hypothetical protein E4656_07095 [Natronospirillum operosum]
MQTQTKQIILFSLFCLLLLAGCSGDSDSTPPDELLLEWTSPEAARAIEPSEHLVARFNQALDASTVSATAFWVETENGDRLYGDISLNAGGRELELVLDEPLQLLIQYEAVLHRDLTSEAGHGLGEHHRWTFVRDIVWSEPDELAPAYMPEDLDESSNYRVRSSAALNRQGAGLIAWAEGTATFPAEGQVFHTRHHDPVLGWSDPEPITEHTGALHLIPDIAVDEAGNILLTWQVRESHPDPDTSWLFIPHYRYYSAEDGWHDLGNGPGEGNTRSLSVGPEPLGDGRFIGQYLRNNEDGERQWIYALFDPDTGWSTDDVPIPGESADIGTVDFTANGQGDALFAWQQRVGEATDGQWMLQYHADTGWSDPHHMTSWQIGPDHDMTIRSLALNDDGKAAALWAGQDEQLASPMLWSAIYEPGEGWSDAEQVTGEYGREALITVAPEGEVLALNSGNTPYRGSLYARRYESGQGWQAPETLTQNLSYPTNIMQARWDDDGSLVLLTLEASDGERDIVVWVYHPEQGWTNGSDFGRMRDNPQFLTFVLPIQGPRIMMMWAYEGPDHQSYHFLSSKGY